jgi:drug/metabolite transporter (DMT)-like permease
MRRALRVSVFDALLVGMVLAWGANYSVMKRAFAEVPPFAFNGMRMALASLVFLTAIRVARRPGTPIPPTLRAVFHTPQALTRRDRWDLVWLGLVGHFGYQLVFAAGVARTHASNAALIIGASPVAVVLLSSWFGRDRVRPLHWLGASLSAVGVYFVVGRGAAFGGSTLAGDLLMVVALGCWAVYTLGSARVMARHSPLYVTGTTMAIGTVPYALLAMPGLLVTRWAAISPVVWTFLVLSALFALCFGYIVWNAAVQRLGATHTAVYGNLVPLAAMVVAALWLHEPMSAGKIAAAGLIVSGVVLTRLQPRTSEVVSKIPPR